MSDPNEISNEINRFFKFFFAKTLQKSLTQVNNFSEKFIVLVITQEQKQGQEMKV